MEKRDQIQGFVNNVRRHLAKLLKPGLGMRIRVYPAASRGAILEIELGEDLANEDYFVEPSQTINDALKEINQTAFGGNLNGFVFKGTNIVMQDNRIIIIKGEDRAEDWNDESARSVVEQLLSSLQRPRK